MYDEADNQRAAADQSAAESLMVTFVPRLRERFGRKLAASLQEGGREGGRETRELLVPGVCAADRMLAHGMAPALSAHVAHCI